MPSNVVNGAKCQCSFGLSPSTLVVVPKGKIINGCKQPIATIQDHIPQVNVMPFGMCTSPSNPTVIAAWGAPAPCVPVTPAPWMLPCTKVKVNNIPAITQSSKLQCAYAGLISVTSSGQTKIEST